MMQTIKTQRLRLSLCNQALADQLSFQDSVLEIMTPAVTKSLPPSFQGLENNVQVGEWLKALIMESKVYLVEQKANVIGFIFIAEQNHNNHVAGHIGYLLGERFWRQGFAFEMLKGLIEHLITESRLHHLIAGVAVDNLGSIGLLEKLGFKRQETIELEMFSYRLELA